MKGLFRESVESRVSRKLIQVNIYIYTHTYDCYHGLLRFHRVLRGLLMSKRFLVWALCVGTRFQPPRRHLARAANAEHR